MTNKIMTIIMVVFAVVLYTMAVVDFMLGKPLDAVCNILFACTDLAVAYMLIRVENQRKALVAFLKLHFDFIEQLKKGVPATLTISKGDDDDEEIPEEDIQQQAGERAILEAQVAEKEAKLKDLETILKKRDEEIAILNKDLDEHKQFLRTLLPIGNVAEPWVPQPELIKSVYASAGVMKQMNEHTDAENLMKLWEQLKAIHKVSTSD